MNEEKNPDAQPEVADQTLKSKLDRVMNLMQITMTLNKMADIIQSVVNVPAAAFALINDTEHLSKVLNEMTTIDTTVAETPGLTREQLISAGNATVRQAQRNATMIQSWQRHVMATVDGPEFQADEAIVIEVNELLRNASSTPNNPTTEGSDD